MRMIKIISVILINLTLVSGIVCAMPEENNSPQTMLSPSLHIQHVNLKQVFEYLNEQSGSESIMAALEGKAADIVLAGISGSSSPALRAFELGIEKERIYNDSVLYRGLIYGIVGLCVGVFLGVVIGDSIFSPVIYGVLLTIIFAGRYVRFNPFTEITIFEDYLKLLRSGDRDSIIANKLPLVDLQYLDGTATREAILYIQCIEATDEVLKSLAQKVHTQEFLTNISLVQGAI
ncbi:MAG: hypothetical protein GY853_00380 [PVC group bacterium]|nr:hypothetical protein [PVC group bacterium]